MVVAALIGGGATLLGSAIGANASKKAANKAVDAQQYATNQNDALIREQMSRADAATSALTPYAAAGASRLASRLGIAPAPSAPRPGNAYAAGGVVDASSYSPNGQPDAGMGGAAGYMQYDPANPSASVAPGNAYAAPQVQSGAVGPANTPQTGYDARAYMAGAAPPTAVQTAGNAYASPNGPSAGTYGDTANPSYTAPTYQDPGKFSYTAADYVESPGYKFQLERGLDAIQSSQASRGAMYSGATAKALEKYAMGLAAQDFGQERGFAASQFSENANRSRANFDTDANRSRSIYDADRNYLTGRYDRETGDILNLTNIGQQATNQQLGSGASATSALQANNNQMAATTGNAAFANANATNGLVTNALQAGGQIFNAYANGNAYANNGVVNSLAGGSVAKPNNLALNTRGNAYSAWG